MTLTIITAAVNGHFDMVSYFLDKGADPNLVTGKRQLRLAPAGHRRCPLQDERLSDDFTHNGKPAFGHLEIAQEGVIPVGRRKPGRLKQRPQLGR